MRLVALQGTNASRIGGKKPCKVGELMNCRSLWQVTP
jgi:hypothetical protein